MDIPLQEREIWVNQEGIPLDERDFDSDESSFALPDRIFIVTTASTPLVQVTTQLPDQLNHDQLFQLNCFFYFTVLATLIGIIMHYHFTRDNGSVSEIICNLTVSICFPPLLMCGTMVSIRLSGLDGREHSLLKTLQYLVSALLFFNLTLYISLIHASDHM